MSAERQAQCPAIVTGPQPQIRTLIYRCGTQSTRTMPRGSFPEEICGAARSQPIAARTQGSRSF